MHAAWLEKKKARDEKIARGEKVGPLERDPTEVTEIGALGILKFIVVLLVVIALSGKFITGSYTWEHRSKWLQVKTYWPVCTLPVPLSMTHYYNIHPISKINACSLRTCWHNITAKTEDPIIWL